MRYKNRRRKSARISLVSILTTSLISAGVLGLFAVPYFFRYANAPVTASVINFPSTTDDEDDSAGTTENTGQTGNTGQEEEEENDQQTAATFTTDFEITDNPSGAKPLCDFSEYYYYTHCSEKERELYEKMLTAIYAFSPSVKVSGTVSDMNYFQDVLVHVIKDHPEVYWVEATLTLYNLGNASELQLTFNRNETECKQLNAEIQDKAKKIRKELNHTNESYETVKDVYTYIANHVEYDLASEDNQNLVSSLVNEVSVCMGYSQMMSYLLQDLGFQAMTVTGMVFPDGPHAWNIVRIDDQYYQCDSTFGDGMYTNGTSFLDLDYLCLSDDVMLKDRSYDTSVFQAPKCTSDIYNP